MWKNSKISKTEGDVGNVHKIKFLNVMKLLDKQLHSIKYCYKYVKIDFQKFNIKN